MFFFFFLRKVKLKASRKREEKEHVPIKESDWLIKLINNLSDSGLTIHTASAAVQRIICQQIGIAFNIKGTVLHSLFSYLGGDSSN